MKILLLAFTGLPLSLAYRPFKAGSKVVTSPSVTYYPPPTEVPGGFNPSELLDSRSRKPEIFNKAMVELKQLESEPICHRVAARLLVNNCRGLEELNEHNLQFNSNAAQRHHVDSFTISLTTCELERMALDVPIGCAPFTSASLFQHAREGREKLEVTAGQVNECLRAIAQDHSSLQTWISYRDKALIFCQAARLDLDKDEAIRLNQKLTQIMEDFMFDANQHLNDMKADIETNAFAAKAFFKAAMNDAESWGNIVQDQFKTVANGAKDIDQAMRNVLTSSSDVTQMMKTFMKTIFEGTATIANEHERALDITTNKFESRMVNIYDMVSETEGKLDEMKALVVDAVGPMIASLIERQDDLDRKTQIVLSAVMNATELLQSHNQKLDQATSKTSRITSDLEKAAAAARSWSENMDVHGGIPDWAIRTISICGSLAVGNIGGSPTLVRNVALLAAGWLTGEGTVQFRNFLATVQILPYLPDCFLWSSRTSAYLSSPTTTREHAKSLNHTEIVYSSQTDDYEASHKTVEHLALLNSRSRHN